VQGRSARTQKLCAFDPLKIHFLGPKSFSRLKHQPLSHSSTLTPAAPIIDHRQDERALKSGIQQVFARARQSQGSEKLPGSQVRRRGGHHPLSAHCLAALCQSQPPKSRHLRATIVNSWLRCVRTGIIQGGGERGAKCLQRCDAHYLIGLTKGN
jgi:hypothetical protein